MTTLIRLFCIACIMILSYSVFAQESDSVKLLTQQSSVKVFVHEMGKLGTSSPLADIELFNAGNKTVTVNLTLKDKNGKMIVGLNGFELIAGKMIMTHNIRNSKWLLDKSNTIEMKVEN